MDKYFFPKQRERIFKSETEDPNTTQRRLNPPPRLHSTTGFVEVLIQKGLAAGHMIALADSTDNKDAAASTLVRIHGGGYRW